MYIGTKFIPAVDEKLAREGKKIVAVEGMKNPFTVSMNTSGNIVQIGFAETLLRMGSIPAIKMVLF